VRFIPAASLIPFHTLGLQAILAENPRMTISINQLKIKTEIDEH